MCRRVGRFEAGWEVDIYSPNGGKCEADDISDPEDASQWQARTDIISRGYKHDPEFVKLLESTKPVDELTGDQYDVLGVAGGQGPMFTFEKPTERQPIDGLDRGRRCRSAVARPLASTLSTSGRAGAIRLV